MQNKHSKVSKIIIVEIALPFFIQNQKAEHRTKTENQDFVKFGQIQYWFIELKLGRFGGLTQHLLCWDLKPTKEWVEKNNS